MNLFTFRPYTGIKVTFCDKFKMKTKLELSPENSGPVLSLTPIFTVLWGRYTCFFTDTEATVMFSQPHSISQSLLMDIYQCKEHSHPENTVLKNKHFFKRNLVCPHCDLSACILCPFSIESVVLSLLIFRNPLYRSCGNRLLREHLNSR